ncbi:MAG TPA: bacillithiol biosynthesis cysteine-adding enzyme BshC [Planctomycetota bacterium]|nr:bacillithiol biosynthesis cysteine-adding enzyme BshC [Planctomycetota bacterium]
MSVARVDRVPYSLAGFGQTLTHDLAYGVPGALSFFPARDFAAVVEQLRKKDYAREELASTLEADLRPFDPPEAVMKNVRLLREANTFVIATGQQAGFLGGPLFTLYKAVSSIKLALQLNEQFAGRAKFVPVFWVAADDHDMPEIDHAHILQPDGEVARVRIPLKTECVGCSAADVLPDSSPNAVAALKEELAAALKDPLAAEALTACYAQKSMSAAFTEQMLRWLGGLGLIVVQSTAVRKFGRDILRRELSDFDITTRLIQEAAVRMKAVRYEPGFSAQMRSAPHFFVTHEPEKIRAALDVAGASGQIVFQERSAAFSERGAVPRTYLPQQLDKLVDSRPELFSASAALRPLVQQAAFPVAGAVLGPGEISYWAQLHAVFQHFGEVFPVVLPRASATLIDTPGQKAMRKLGIEPASPELFADAETLQKRAAVSNEVGSSMQRNVDAILAHLAEMESEVQKVDGGLKSLFDKARERISHELQRVAEKTQASLGQREGAAVVRAKYLASLVRPRKALQERTLACAPFLLRYPDLPRDLLDTLDPLAREHFVITLG